MLSSAPRDVLRLKLDQKETADKRLAFIGGLEGISQSWKTGDLP